MGYCERNPSTHGVTKVHHVLDALSATGIHLWMKKFHCWKNWLQRLVWIPVEVGETSYSELMINKRGLF